MNFYWGKDVLFREVSLFGGVLDSSVADCAKQLIHMYYPRIIIIRCIDILQHNSFQAVLVTDGHNSYCLFIYHCGLLTTRQAAIGYTATGNFFLSHPNSQMYNSIEVACSNSPGSEWNTLLYPIHYNGKRERERERYHESARIINSH